MLTFIACKKSVEDTQQNNLKLQDSQAMKFSHEVCKLKSYVLDFIYEPFFKKNQSFVTSCGSCYATAIQ